MARKTQRVSVIKKRVHKKSTTNKKKAKSQKAKSQKAKNKKPMRPKHKKMRGGAFLFPSISALSDGVGSGLTGLYNNVKGNTQVYDSNVFNQPINKM